MSGEAKHTPGPWVVAGKIFEHSSPMSPEVEIHALRTYVEGAEPTRYRLAKVIYPTTQEGSVGANERMANARLIAAAPETAAERDRLREVNAEMLAALKGLRPIIEAAESNASGNLEWPRVSARINAARAAIAKAEALR